MSVGKTGSSSASSASRAAQTQRSQETQSASAKADPAKADPTKADPAKADATTRAEMDPKRVAVDPAVQADARMKAQSDLAAQNHQRVAQSQDVRAARPPDASDPATAQTAVEIYAGVNQALGDQIPAQDFPDLAGLQHGTSVEAVGKLNLPNGTQARLKVEASIGSSLNTGLNEQERVTLKITGSLSAGRGGKIGIGSAAELGANVSVGTALNYRVSMSKEQYAAIRAGQAPLPNPFDPQSIPPGGSVMLNASAFTRSQVEATFRGIGIDSAHLETQGLSIGVARLDDDNVRIHAGPSEMVRNEMGLGVELGPLSVGIGAEKSLISGSARVADIDLSSTAGREAYDRFLSTGQFPNSETPGVSNSGTVRNINFSQELSVGAELDLGPVKVGGSLEINSAEARRRIVEYDDGRTVDSFRNRFNDTSLVTTQTTGPGGIVDPDKSGTSLLFNNMDPELSMHLNMAFTGEQQRFAGPQDVEMKLSQTQLQGLQERVREGMAQNPMLEQDPLYQNIRDATDPYDFAARVIPRMDIAFLPGSLLNLHLQDPGQRPLDGSVAFRGND
jgi:hypothetical protein